MIPAEYVDLSPGLGFGCGVQLAANCAVIWVASNHMLNLGEPIPLRKCVFASVALTLVALLSFAILRLPIPIVGLLLAPFVWWKGSVAAIEGTLDVTRGGALLWGITAATGLALVFMTVVLQTGVAPAQIFSQCVDYALRALIQGRF